MEQQLDLAVILVTYNSSSVLEGFLESLPPACEGLSWRLVVADNASEDDSVDLVRAAVPDAIIVHTGGNLGYAAGINAAVDAAPPSNALLITNPDIRAPAGSVAPLVQRLSATVGIVGPRIVDESGTTSLSLHRAPTIMGALGDALLGAEGCRRWWPGEVVTDPRIYDTAIDVDWLSGAFMVVSRDCHDQIGGWDPRFFLYSEETDFQLRAADAGWRVRYDPVSTVTHLGGESDTSPTLYTMLAVNKVRLFAKRHGRALAALYAAVVVVSETVRSISSRQPAVHRAALAALVLPWRRPPQVRGRLERARHGSATTSRPELDPPGWICFSAQDWWYHNRAHSDFQLMRRVARERPVLFVNSIGMRMPAPGRSTQVTRRILRKARSVLRFMSAPLADTPRFHVLTPVILPFYGSPLLRRVNAWLVRQQVRYAARRVGIRPRDAIIMVTIPTAWDVVEPMQRRSLVVNRSDLHSAFGEADQDFIRGLERELLVHGDVVLYTSRSLMETEGQLAGDRAIFFDHGVDLEHFRSDGRPPPSDLDDLKGPVIGFFGGLDDYLVDFELLQDVANSIPDATVVLVGDANCDLDDLPKGPNVRWLGFRPYEDIPAYGARFDVALMPWLRNEWIEHANPIKLKEYLALGLPVVSTRFPEVEHYRDHIAVAADAADFVDKVRDALEGRAPGTPESRRARVEASSWDGRSAALVAVGEGTVVDDMTAARPIADATVDKGATG